MLRKTCKRISADAHQKPYLVSWIRDSGTNLPHPGVPRKRPTPEQPTLIIVQPPPRIYKLIETHICETFIWELAIPLVFDFCNQARVFVVEYVDLAIYDLLHATDLHNVAGTQVHSDRVATGGNFVVEALDLGEGSLEAIPLSRVLSAPCGRGNWVYEGGLIIP